MKLFRPIYFLITVVFTTTLFSCGVSKNTTTGNFIQKRKYTRGFYVHSRQRVQSVITECKDFDEGVNASDVAEINLIKKREVVFADQNAIRNVISPKPTLPESENRNPEFKEHKENVNFKSNEQTASYRNPHTSHFNKTLSASPEKIKEEVDFVKLYKNEIRRNYRLAWGFTLLAIFSLVGFIALVGTFALAPFFFAILTLAMYISMFVFLVRTGQNLKLYLHSGGEFDSYISTTNFFLWLHIVVGSFFSLILFLIPLLICNSKIKGTSNYISRI